MFTLSLSAVFIVPYDVSFNLLPSFSHVTSLWRCFFAHKKDDLLQSSLPDFYFIFIGALRPQKQHLHVYSVEVDPDNDRVVCIAALFLRKISSAVKSKTMGKVRKFKDFQDYRRYSNTMVSTCESLSKLFPIGMLISLSMIGSRKVIDFSHCPLGCRSS